MLVTATARPLAKADHEDLLDRGDFPDCDYSTRRRRRALRVQGIRLGTAETMAD